MDATESILTPISIEELLKQYPYGHRITGWDPQNPPEIERAFRGGYLTGVRRFVESRAFGFVQDEPGDMELASNLNEHLHELRAKIYDSDRWTDRRAALLRGCQHGLLDAVRARASGASIRMLHLWLDEVRAWAGEAPLRLDWEHAGAPEPPEPDAAPLGRDDVPLRLWSEVFGMVALMPATPRAPVAPIPGRRAVLVRLSDVQPELVHWLWPNRIAVGKLTLLCGDPGLGKSFITLDLAARASSGAPWPDLPSVPDASCSVVLLSAEDDLADTIRPRLDAAGARVDRIVALKAIRQVRDDGAVQEDSFDLTADLPALERAIKEVGDCRLVVIDPLTAYLGKTDSHNNAEVRAVLARLFELAARHKVAVLAVTHLNKANTLPAIYRAMGSLAFVAAARAVWAVVRDDQDETGHRRFFVPIKNNLGADDTGLAYALEQIGSTARVAWESGVVNMRADDALDGGGRKAAVKEDAQQFVIDTVTANGGDMLSDDLSLAAEAAGISERTLRRAKKAVAESYKEKGQGGRWRCKVKGGQGDPGVQVGQLRPTWPPYPVDTPPQPQMTSELGQVGHR